MVPHTNRIFSCQISQNVPVFWFLTFLFPHVLMRKKTQSKKPRPTKTQSHSKTNGVKGRQSPKNDNRLLCGHRSHRLWASLNIFHPRSHSKIFRNPYNHSKLQVLNLFGSSKASKKSFSSGKSRSKCYCATNNSLWVAGPKTPKKIRSLTICGCTICLSAELTV